MFDAFEQYVYENVPVTRRIPFIKKWQEICLDREIPIFMSWFEFSDACHPYEPFRCPGDGHCISIQYLCDGAPDCDDG